MTIINNYFSDIQLFSKYSPVTLHLFFLLLDFLMKTQNSWVALFCFLTNSLKFRNKVLVQYSVVYLKCFHGHKLEKDTCKYGRCHFYPFPKSKDKRW